MTEGALYHCDVTHTRHVPKHHHLHYRLFMILLDLDAIDGVSKRLRLFTVGGRNLFSFHAADHGVAVAPDTPDALKGWARSVLSEAGITQADGRIRLLCMPRVLGYAFNPISVYFCEDKIGNPAAVIYEVHNTFKQRHCYVCPLDTPRTAALFEHEAEKEFHVSPFMPMDMRYHFRVTIPASRMLLHIKGAARADGASMIDAVLAGRRMPLTDGALFHAFVKMPFMGLKVVAAIHWEALKLWRRKLPFYRLPPAPPRPHTLGS